MSRRQMLLTQMVDGTIGRLPGIKGRASRRPSAIACFLTSQVTNAWEVGRFYDGGGEQVGRQLLSNRKRDIYLTVVGTRNVNRVSFGDDVTDKVPPCASAIWDAI